MPEDETTRAHPTADDFDAALVEAYLENHVAEQDPWQYLDTIVEHQMPLALRAQVYTPFIAMVALRSDAERDALLTAGQAVFRYRIDTARRDVQALRDSGSAKPRIAPTVIGPDYMADLVYRPGQVPAIKYAIYRAAEGAVEYADRLQVEGFLYTPPQSRLADLGVLALPSEAVEYDNEDWLAKEIRHFISSYLHIPDKKILNLIMYYVFLTWIHDRFEVVPYLRARGEWGTGKTRLLQVVGAVTYHACLAGGATTAAPIFRLMDRFRGTLLIDEADFGQSELWTDIVKILNVGYQRGTAVLRAERGGSDSRFEIEGFDCFGPKVLSTRKGFEDPALESRCLTYTMQSVPVPDRIPFFLDQEFRDRARTLRNHLLLWRFRRYEHAWIDPRRRLDGLDPRLNQILLPLLACADADGMRTAIVEQAKHYQRALGEDKRESTEGQIAAAVVEQWRKRTGRDVMFSQVIERLHSLLGDTVKLTNKYVSERIRHALGLTKVKRGGIAWVRMTDADADRLVRHYNLAEDDQAAAAEQAAAEQAAAEQAAALEQAAAEQAERDIVVLEGPDEWDE